MNGFRKTKNINAIGLIAGFLAAVWVGQTHAHFDEDPYEIDRVCSVCLVGENVSHFIVTAAFEQSAKSAAIEQTNISNLPVSALVYSYYLSRAPPLIL